MFLILLTIASIAVLIIFCWLSTWTAQPNYDLSQSSILIYTLRILSGEVNTISTQHSPRNESTAVLPSLLSEEASEYLNNLEEPNNQESIPIDRSTIMSHYDVVDESNHESLTEINPTVTNDCLTESCCPQQQSNDNNSINVYFRMLNESQKVVHARPTQTIEDVFCETMKL
ncbi:hypothetical protein GJ496_000476 [Pomphorhynchus laevis]|nr:hypothetical protein GJ496_000476 [Pomphorhynchus laevis]